MAADHPVVDPDRCSCNRMEPVEPCRMILPSPGYDREDRKSKPLYPCNLSPRNSNLTS
jgi:hypothetical protein